MVTTLIINIIGGPGIGKTTMAADIFAKMKKLGHSVEYIPEYAKGLVWLENWDELNNQWMVTYRQANLVKSMIGKVDFIVTDAPVILGSYYNIHNEKNTSNPVAVEKLINQFVEQHPNKLDVLLGRNLSNEFSMNGRIHNLKESVAIDCYFKEYLDKGGSNYIFIPDAHDPCAPLIIIEEALYAHSIL